MNEVGIYNFHPQYIIQYYSCQKSKDATLVPLVGAKITFWNSFPWQTTYTTENQSKSGYVPN